MDATVRLTELGMGKKMVRQRIFITVLVGIACLNATAVLALQPPESALEARAQVEFSRVATSVRERLEREAAGDPVGARIAAQDADAHRYRFLDIKREISRRLSPTVPSPSEDAPRNPFVPDASFFALSASSTSRVAPVTAGRNDPRSRLVSPAWDMYRSHDSRDPAGTDGAQPHQESQSAPAAVPVRWPRDMYSNGLAKPTSSDGDGAKELSESATPGESPREPFLVYRERLADGGAPE
jgi:hypothetical protein